MFNFLLITSNNQIEYDEIKERYECLNAPILLQLVRETRKKVITNKNDFSTEVKKV